MNIQASALGEFYSVLNFIYEEIKALVAQISATVVTLSCTIQSEHIYVPLRKPLAPLPLSPADCFCQPLYEDHALCYTLFLRNIPWKSVTKELMEIQGLFAFLTVQFRDYSSLSPFAGIARMLV